MRTGNLFHVNVVNVCGNYPWKMDPYHHSMASLQIADGGKTSNTEVSCEYIYTHT
jgi:hypothetical protein